MIDYGIYYNRYDIQYQLLLDLSIYQSMLLVDVLLWTSGHLDATDAVPRCRTSRGMNLVEDVTIKNVHVV